MKHLVCLLFITLNLQAEVVSKLDIRINDASKSSMVELAMNKLIKATACLKISNNKCIVLIDAKKEVSTLQHLKIDLSSTASEGYNIISTYTTIYVIGGDAKGLMYGILDLRDQCLLNPDLSRIIEKTEAPRFHFRAIKFNLPWSSYRLGESLQLHMETAKDLKFWEAFLDMMVDNRFNTLTLWNLHPFTFMIQPKAFPEATQFTGQEFKDWQTFWRSLFKMAKERGIETYIINWNIIVSPQMTEAHNVANYKDDLEWHYGYTPADTSPIIVDYMRECITQVINEYPDLTGVGVSVGERMKMPINEAMNWIKQTFVEGIKNANRPAKFIHRAPFSISPVEARKYIESYTDFESPIIMEFKYNWSHGHSSPKLSITHGGKINDQYWNPKPKNYEMAWMMRNEDFIMLNWGHTDFIKAHIAANGQDFVAGYFVGSETYIPAKEFRMKPEVDYNWTYAFEKQWEFYQMWGRLLYNPELEDTFFEEQFNLKYGGNVGTKMFKALKLASRMPLALASFYQGTWDFTLYCEGFLNGKSIYRNYKEATKAFINIEEMTTHPTLDKSYVNIDDYITGKIAGEDVSEDITTPEKLASEMANNGTTILNLCNAIANSATKNHANFNIELNDIKTWAYLSLYFSEKLKGAMYLDEAIKTKNKTLQQNAIVHLENAVVHWDNIIKTTNKQYQPVSLLHIKTTKFSWGMFRSQVLKDIEIAKNAVL